MTFLCSAATTSAQTAPQVVAPVDNAQKVVLNGNVYPFARAEFDQGPVADGLPMKRMLLLLKRSPERQAALAGVMESQHDKSSALYHQWFTPEQFGAQFGPADADVQAVTQWLASQGFGVEKVYTGKTVVEFSGTAAQVRAAFATDIRNYRANGTSFSANAGDPQIPAALAPVVEGIVSLNNYPRQFHAIRRGGAHREAGKIGLQPEYTMLNQSFYGVGPGDFATIYNSKGLIASGNKGTGQTIAIVGETNINIQDVVAFRSVFGLPPTFSASNVILNGEDPGITSISEESEADLDVQWSGAVAPGATVNLVVSASTPASAGIDLSALYIIEHNLAGVMSESYGSCENALGTAGNAFYRTLWEQAAAQGITVILSSGDGGSAGCDNFDTETQATQGLAVSGNASTPFNVSVGGTDFDQVTRTNNFWNSTNDSVTGTSAIGYIPEIPWNQNCAQLGITGCGASAPSGSVNIVAGSGGPSDQYTKPTWQLGVTGMPNDNHRDQPDISLFASPGFNGSGYLICQSDAGSGPCVSFNGASSIGGLNIIGGTSASAPAFAGIMALVNQSQSQPAPAAPARQGNANYVLYQLAKKSSTTNNTSCASIAIEPATCIFYYNTNGNSSLPNGAIGVGTNSVPCQGGSANCSTNPGGPTGVLVDPLHKSVEAWTVGTVGTVYNVATGLGSVNIANLVSNWSSVSNVATTTTLSLGKLTGLTHGINESVTVNIAVTPTSATGQVSLIAQFQGTSGSTTQGLDQFTLGTGGKVSGTTNSLPGGTYTVVAHYAGDGTNAPSDSAPVSVTVAPESSKTFIVVPSYDIKTGNLISGNANSVPYGSPYRFRLYVTNASGVANPTGPPSPTCDQVNELTCPTGTVTLTANGTGVDRPNGTYNLDSFGYTRDINPTLGGGTYLVVAQYNGDNSYSASTSATDSLTVTQAATSTVLPPSNGTYYAGSQYTFNATTTSQSFGAAPTGSVTLLVDGVAATIVNNQTTGQSGAANGTATLQSYPTIAISTSGSHSVTAIYPGDGNYAGSTSAATPIQIVYPTSIAIAISSPTVVAGIPVTLTATVMTTVKSPAITPGVVKFLDQDGLTVPGTTTYTVLTDANGNTQLQATLVGTPLTNLGIYAQYSGDNNFGANQSNLIFFTYIVPDYAVNPAQPALTVTAGQSGSVTVTLVPTTNYTTTVQLQVASSGLPEGTSCTVSPSQVVLSNGNSATATATCSVLAPSSNTTATEVFPLKWPHPDHQNPWWRAAGLLMVLSVVFWLLPVRFRLRRPAYAMFLSCVLSLALGCGGGSSGGVGVGGGAGLSATTTTLSAASTKVPGGTNLQATVQVTGNSPTGTVALSDGTFGQNSNTLTNGKAQFSYYLGSPGAHSMFAAYLGDSQNAPSQTHTPLVVVYTGTSTYSVISASSPGTIAKQPSFLITIQ